MSLANYWLKIIFPNYSKTNFKEDLIQLVKNMLFFTPTPKQNKCKFKFETQNLCQQFNTAQYNTCSNLPLFDIKIYTVNKTLLIIIQKVH